MVLPSLVWPGVAWPVLPLQHGGQYGGPSQHHVGLGNVAFSQQGLGRLEVLPSEHGVVEGGAVWQGPG